MATECNIPFNPTKHHFFEKINKTSKTKIKENMVKALSKARC
jgi:hypothetical protein